MQRRFRLVTFHATQVAQVAIGRAIPQGLYEGVAPQANLHSNGVDDIIDDRDVAQGFEFLARLGGPMVDVKAINASFVNELGDPLLENADGNSHITQYLDWSSREYDVLYSIAWGNVENPARRAMVDSYNNIVVASSDAPNEQTAMYSKFAGHNNTEGHPVGERAGIHILAPGTFMRLRAPVGAPGTVGGEWNPPLNGTSYATPHVTGAVALLQQFAQQQIDGPNPLFDQENAKRHEVMKAVMLNSADKFNGAHGSKRDITDADGGMWMSGGPTNPLDRDLGAGHLNVKRAVDQLAPGEYDGGNVPLIGWDYGSTGPDGQNVYTLNAGLTANKYIAVTLTWDRINDKNEEGPYTGTDTFFGNPVNDLNLYLMAADETDINNAVAMSISPDDTIEHIFFKDFAAGNYKIVVKHNGDSQGGAGTDIDYALAWWHGQDTPPFIPGDFDGDGDVDGPDLEEWQFDFGQTSGSDADGDGDSDGADFLVWQQNLGMTSATPAAAAVPEPAGAMLCTLAASLLWMSRRRR